MDNFQKMIIGSSGNTMRREPILKYYVGRENPIFDLLLPPEVGEYNPNKNHYQMGAEDNLSPLEIVAGFYDPDKMIKSANLLITNKFGLITPLTNLPINRINENQGVDTTINPPALNRFFDTYFDIQPEFSVIMEINLRNNKVITLDAKQFMRYRLSGRGSNLLKSTQGAYKVYEFSLYVDGVMAYEPHDLQGCHLMFDVINAVPSQVPDFYYTAIVEAVDLGRTWSIKGNSIATEYLNFRPDLPETLPKEKLSPMKMKVSIYAYGQSADATVQIYIRREESILRQFTINNLI